MQPARAFDYSEYIYIPISAEKGDCCFCQEGVLRREKNVEDLFKVREGYQCDTCGRFFIEGVVLAFMKGLSRDVKFRAAPIPRRYFVEASKDGFCVRCSP